MIGFENVFCSSITRIGTSTSLWSRSASQLAPTCWYVTRQYWSYAGSLVSIWFSWGYSSTSDQTWPDLVSGHPLRLDWASRSRPSGSLRKCGILSQQRCGFQLSPRIRLLHTLSTVIVKNIIEEIYHNSSQSLRADNTCLLVSNIHQPCKSYADAHYSWDISDEFTSGAPQGCILLLRRHVCM